MHLNSLFVHNYILCVFKTSCLYMLLKIFLCVPVAHGWRYVRQPWHRGAKCYWKTQQIGLCQGKVQRWFPPLPAQCLQTSAENEERNISTLGFLWRSILLFAGYSVTKQNKIVVVEEYVYVFVYAKIVYNACDH